MEDVPLFAPGIVVNGVVHTLKSVAPGSPKAHVDVNTEKMRRVREEEEFEEQRRAHIEYARYVNDVKRPRCAVDEDDEEELVDYEEPNKRVRSYDKQTDDNWHVETSNDTSRTLPIPVMYPWQREFEALRELSPSTDEDGGKTCFACTFMSVASHEVIYADDWRMVVDYFQATLPQCPNARQLGLDLYDFFERTVVASLRQRGVITDPEMHIWSPHGILDHFMNHTRDPTIQMWRDYMAYTEIHSTIVNNEMFERHPESGRVRTSADALKKLKIISEMRERVMRVNPHQLPHSSSESNAVVPCVHPFTQMKERPSLAAQPRWNS